MDEDVRERLSAAQSRYDELEESLKTIPEFRAYLSGGPAAGSEPAHTLAQNPKFLEWRQLAVTITVLYGVIGEAP